VRFTTWRIYTNWNNEEWFAVWDTLGDVTSSEEERSKVNEMLDIFYNDPPWLMLYFQPDFYGVSNRLDWSARRDEWIVIYNATLK
jgi:peptide/nickel transport system substrate-binding protein